MLFIWAVLFGDLAVGLQDELLGSWAEESYELGYGDFWKAEKWKESSDAETKIIVHFLPHELCQPWVFICQLFASQVGLAVCK